MDWIMPRIPSWNPKYITGTHIKVLVITVLIASIVFYTSPFVLERVHLQSIPSAVHTHINGEGPFAEIDGEFDQSAFRELCDKKEWVDGLVFDCMPPQGGIGNVRNVFMNCVRYAIEGGAGIIISGVVARDDTDLSKLTTTNILPFSYFFDDAYFVDSLKTACPQMKVYLSAESVENQDQATRPFPALQLIDPLETVYGTILAHPEQWRKRFDSWRNTPEVKAEIGHEPSASLPAIINIGTPLLQFPLAGDSEEFTSQFGRIFKFRQEIDVLAATIIREMSNRYELDLHQDEAGIKKGAYYGAHLRTAEDAVKAGWQSYEQQSKQYLEHAKREGLSTVYVTSGSVEDIEKFVADAARPEYNMAVATKLDLLNSTVEMREMLGNLTWDQQGLVDYQVLLRSSAFGGISTSSFAWNIAIRRHVLAAREGRGRDYLETNVTLKDEYSTLFGETGEWPWFWAGMWP